MKKLLLGLVILEGFLAAPFLAANTEVVTADELWKLFDKRMLPVYPYEARRAHAEGSGLYRLYINSDGSVRAVGVMKSTGNKSSTWPRQVVWDIATRSPAAILSRLTCRLRSLLHLAGAGKNPRPQQNFSPTRTAAAK